MDDFFQWKQKRVEAVGNQWIHLSRIEMQDGPRLAELANNRKIWDNVRDYFPHPYTSAHAYEFIRALYSEENHQPTFAIRLEGELCGVIGLQLQTDVYRKSAELGYWLGEPFWNRGVVSQAVHEILDFGFNQLELVRIFAGVFAHNPASARVLEKNGFILEGIARKAALKNGIFTDELRYALVI